MFNTFNMGVGMSIVVAPQDVDKALATELEMLKKAGIDKYIEAAQAKVDKFMQENNLEKHQKGKLLYVLMGHLTAP